MSSSQQQRGRGGQFSIQVIFFSAIAVIMITGFLVLVLTFVQLSVRAYNKNVAFSISEAGIEYYRWHLAHASTDYQDGTGQAGPYIHDFFDKDGNKIGQFILDITPPSFGSTVVKVRSTGKVVADSSVSRIIEVRLGQPTLAQYALVGNASMAIGAGVVTYGPVFGNSGIHFDGYANNLVQSAITSYKDPDHAGANEYAVHTHVSSTDPLPTSTLPNRPDVFGAGRSFPAAAVDFAAITQNLANIKSLAQASGTYFGSSTVFGYDLVFSPSSTYSVYKVTSLAAVPSSGCVNVFLGIAGWGTWSIGTETLFATGTTPAVGVMFFEDNLWVRGQINGSRVTVGSGRFPDNVNTRANIIVNTNLLYSRYDGSDAIGLVTQNNFNIGLFSDDSIRIDATLVAQYGRAGRYYYLPADQFNTNCDIYATRNALTLYGMIVTNKRYGFGYADGTGYVNRSLIYDENLLYNPPVVFPTTSQQYVQLTWDEVQ